jgi:hypothetical protein
VTLALLCELSFSDSAAAQFETRSTTALGSSPFSVAAGDFNHDGKLDTAVADANQIQILLGNGDGTFQAPVNYVYGGAPLSVAAADLNHDGNLDLVVANLDSGVSVLLGNGDGTFQAAMNFNTPSSSNFVGIGDFNGDHKPDLIVSDGPYVSVLLGNGDGTFQSPIDTDVTSLGSLAWGDFNGDGVLDFAITRNAGFVQEVVIYLGNGDGTFREGSHYSSQEPPQSIAVGDFDGDGKLDMAVALEFDAISIFLGNGDGTFRPPVNYPVSGPYWAAVGDFNGDGKLDLVAATNFVNNSQASGVSVLLGNGDGTFQPATSYVTGIDSAFVVVGDFNNDRQQDLADLDRSFADVTVLLNTGVVSFSPTTPLTFPSQFLGKVGAPLTTMLTNTGTTDLSISSISVASPFRLSKLTTCGANLARGSSCAITATFKPLTTGLFTGAVTIVDSASSKPQFVELVGSGIAVTLSPGQLNFPPQKVGTISPPQKVTVANRGGATVQVVNIILSGLDDFSYYQTNDCGTQIGPGASCTISVEFTPQAKGKLGGLVDVILGATSGPLQVTLRGTGK